jgi:hypothetical protein
MMAVTCAAGALGTWAEWQRHQVASDAGLAAYVSAENVAANIAVLWLLAYLTTGVTFLTWAWRARCNAERLSALSHRLRRGWTIGGWLVPVAPLIVLEDVWRTSRPGLPRVEHARDLPRATLVHYWWFAALACGLAGMLLAVTREGEPTLDALLDIASVTTAVAVLQIVTAALAIPMVRQITRWQTDGR